MWRDVGDSEMGVNVQTLPPSECKYGANSQRRRRHRAVCGDDQAGQYLWHSSRRPADPSLLIQLTPSPAHAIEFHQCSGLTLELQHLEAPVGVGELS